MTIKRYFRINFRIIIIPFYSELLEKYNIYDTIFEFKNSVLNNLIIIIDNDSNFIIIL